jgi:hypothetical protein
MTPTDLITELRSAAKGSEEWHVKHLETKVSYAIFTFCDSGDPQREAVAFREKMNASVGQHLLVERVTAYTPQERLLQRAADCIEELIGGEQGCLS